MAGEADDEPDGETRREDACRTCGETAAAPVELGSATDRAFEDLLGESPSFACDSCRRQAVERYAFAKRARAFFRSKFRLRADKATQFEEQPSANVKQEPDDYDSYEHALDACDVSSPEHEFLINQIKIEPLSENDALRFHQETLPTEEYKINEFTDYECNGYLSSNEDSENDNKPTEEELNTYAENFDGDSFVCNQCGERFVTKVAFWRHKESHKAITQKCVLCDKFFKTRRKLKRHVITRHSYNELVQCDVYDSSFKSPSELASHKDRHVLLKKKYYCTLCTSDFTTELHLKEHLYTHREIVILKTDESESMLCSKCNILFNNVDELLSHMENVCNEVKYSNDIGVKSEDNGGIKDFCEYYNTTNYETQNKQSVKKKGILKKKSPEEIDCPQCYQKFSNKYFLRIHIENHSAYFRNYCCPICLFKFKRKDHLKRHLINVHNILDPKKRK